MSIKRTALAALVAMTVTVPASMNCMAVTTSADATICDMYNRSCTSNIFISGKTANCQSKVIGIPGKTTQIGINQVLEKKNSAGTWVYCKSSSITVNETNAYLENNFKNLSKGTYRLKTSAVIHAGKYYENVVRYSPEKTVK